MTKLKQRLGLFQNLYLMALADNLISEEEERLLADFAQRLDISKEQVAYVMEHSHQLDFVIPEAQEAKLSVLQAVTRMAAVDGDVGPQERDLCVAMGTKLGFPRATIEEALARAMQRHGAIDSAAGQRVAANIAQYRQVFGSLQDLGLAGRHLAAEMGRMVDARTLDPEGLFVEHQLLLWRFLWLCFVRSIRLEPGQAALLPMQLSLIQGGVPMRELFDYLEVVEETYGAKAEPLRVLDMSPAELQRELDGFWDTLL